MTSNEQALREQIALELIDAHEDEAANIVLAPMLHTVVRNAWDIPLPHHHWLNHSSLRPIIPWPGLDAIKPEGCK